MSNVKCYITHSVDITLYSPIGVRPIVYVSQYTSSTL